MRRAPTARIVARSLPAVLAAALGGPLALVCLSCGGAAGATSTTGAGGSNGVGPGADAPLDRGDAWRAQAPVGPLSDDVTPLGYELRLELDPSAAGLAGRARVRVRVARALHVIWLHGRGLEVSRAHVRLASGEEITGEWTPVGEEGVVGLRLPRDIGPGEATLEIGYRAPYDEHLAGAYKVTAGDASYVFTQFEPIDARKAFPGFDDPRFKAPFDVTLVVPTGMQAVANTAQLEERTEEGRRVVRFRPTAPLPTYLVAWAVGPLDIVDGPTIPANAIRSEPIALRGVAVRGRGPALRYALDRTGAIVTALEEYFGVAYAWGKLDVIAVPDFEAGAMENAGAITFRDSFLLVDEHTATEDQRRAFAGIMAHELAHQWVGNLVTMRWWDDLWLNEAAATWAGYRTVAGLYPDYGARTEMAGEVLGAMHEDGLASARRIREPIRSTNDIQNAFDGITYSKGGGVIAMFERWLGPDVFRRGVQTYLERHRFGAATADDLLSALSETSGRDVATPFRTFLDQPGVPLVETRLACDGGRPRIVLHQARWLPLGSTAQSGAGWQIPVCARYRAGAQVRESCALLSSADGELALEGGVCPDWYFPNADASGYYRFAVRGDDLAHLRASGWAELTTTEKLSFAAGLGAAIASGATPAGEAYAMLDTLARDPSRAVATAPMELLEDAHEHLVSEALAPRVQALGRRLYAPLARRLGWGPPRGATEPGETTLLRGEVLRFLALEAEDPAVRREAAARGRRWLGMSGRADASAVSADLLQTALSVAAQEGGAPVFDALVARLGASDDSVQRGAMLRALGATRSPELAERARMLLLDSAVRTSEIGSVLWTQSEDPRLAGAIMEWLTTHVDPLVHKAGPAFAGYTPWLAASFCTEERAAAAEAFFRPRVSTWTGGPRNLDGALEVVRLCVARAHAQTESASAFFARAR